MKSLLQTLIDETPPQAYEMVKRMRQQRDADIYFAGGREQWLAKKEAILSHRLMVRYYPSYQHRVK